MLREYRLLTDKEVSEDGAEEGDRSNSSFFRRNLSRFSYALLTFSLAVNFLLLTFLFYYRPYHSAFDRTDFGRPDPIACSIQGINCLSTS